MSAREAHRFRVVRAGTEREEEELGSGAWFAGEEEGHDFHASPRFVLLSSYRHRLPPLHRFSIHQQTPTRLLRSHLSMRSANPSLLTPKSMSSSPSSKSKQDASLDSWIKALSHGLAVFAGQSSCSLSTAALEVKKSEIERRGGWRKGREREDGEGRGRGDKPKDDLSSSFSLTRSPNSEKRGLARSA